MNLNVPSISYFAVVYLVFFPLFGSIQSKERESPIDTQENGQWNSVVRDAIREVALKLKKIKAERDLDKTFSNDSQDFKSRIRAIFPGTKWCGDGNVSNSFDELGLFSSTDSCCREHDTCFSSIQASSSKFGLENTGLFKRSHCDCEGKFHECLKAVNSVVSESIGHTYFTILGPQCFREDHPVVGCNQRRNGRCIKYSYDFEREKVYQWFDNPTFY